MMSCVHLLRVGRDGRDDHRLLEIEGIESDVLVLLQLLDELQECRVADDVDPLDIGGLACPEHEPKSSPDGLLRKDVGLRCVRAKANNDGDVLHVPAFAKHQNAHDGVDRAAALIHTAGYSSGGVEVLL